MKITLPNGSEREYWDIAPDETGLSARRMQLEENFEARPEDSFVDAALSANGVPDDTDGEIEEIAHLCRADYLGAVAEFSPESYVKGVVGADRHLSGMILKEAEYEAGQVKKTGM